MLATPKRSRDTETFSRTTTSAFEALLVNVLPSLRRWAHGLLPQGARRRADTEDLVQDAVVGVLRVIGEGSSVHPAALRRYLMTAIQNRIRDEVKRCGKGEVRNLGLCTETELRQATEERAAESENQREYRLALLKLEEDDKLLLIGRIELGLTYEELAIATGRRSPAAARMAARRAALRLARTLESSSS